MSCGQVIEGLATAVDLAARSGAKNGEVAASRPRIAPRVCMSPTAPVAASSWVSALRDVQQRCLDMARELELERRDLAAAGTLTALEELHRLLQGVHMVGHASPRVSARVLAYGPLISSQIAHAHLCATLRRDKIPAVPRLVDSRAVLVSAPRKAQGGQAPHKESLAGRVAAYLEAHVPVRCNPRQAAAVAGHDAEVVVSQARTARNATGETVMLGWGGNGGSAALMAAMLSADTLMLLTSVRGIYTCDPHLLSSLPVRAAPHTSRISPLPCLWAAWACLGGG